MCSTDMDDLVYSYNLQVELTWVLLPSNSGADESSPEREKQKGKEKSNRERKRNGRQWRTQLILCERGNYTGKMEDSR